MSVAVELLYPVYCMDIQLLGAGGDVVALDPKSMEHRPEGVWDSSTPAKGHCMVLDKLWAKVFNEFVIEGKVLFLLLECLLGQGSVVAITHLNDVDMNRYLSAAQALPDLLRGDLVAGSLETCNDQQIWLQFQFHRVREVRQAAAMRGGICR